MSTVIFVPRWGGTAESDWLPRVRAGLRAPSLVVELAPDPGAPTPRACVDRLRAEIGADTLADTVLVGHSVGCQALLRWLATLPEGSGARATLLVAPWRTVDEPWPSLLPWLAPVDLERARRAAGTVRALVSDDDPFTADDRATRAWLERDLGARVRVVSGGRHFNRADEPEVVAALAALTSG